MTTGLRERKKLAAMRRVQDVALDLTDEHGYEALTIERMAEVAEVSPSSVYRYFGTKEQVFLWDEYDPQLMAVFSEQLQRHGPVAAMRIALAHALEEFFDRDEERVRRRVRYLFEVPDLWSAGLASISEMVGLAAGVLAQATGREPTDLDVMVVAETLVAALVAALKH
jgi:AcrR family transcriptional regulator